MKKKQPQKLYLKTVNLYVKYNITLEITEKKTLPIEYY